MALLLVSFILMALVNVEASRDPNQIDPNFTGDSIPSHIPVAYRSRDDPWLQKKSAELERARLERLNSLDGRLETQNVIPHHIKRRSAQRKQSLQRPRPTQNPGSRQCYFNPISCF